jgi:preprotein translocase subunit SecA
MVASDVSEMVQSIRQSVIDSVVNQHIPPGSIDEQWDVSGLQEALASEFGLHLDITGWLEADDTLHEETLRERIIEAIENAYKEKETLVSPEVMRHFEKAAMLQVLDFQWKEHLAMMDHLRQGIHLRGYAQQNPKQEFKREAFELFQEMLERIKHDVIALLSKVQVRTESDVEAVEHQRRTTSAVQYQHAAASAMAEEPSNAANPTDLPDTPESKAPYVRDSRKVGRNESCPCGSGRKYKHCHGKLN